jgi:hypothetical protein
MSGGNGCFPYTVRSVRRLSPSFSVHVISRMLTFPSSRIMPSSSGQAAPSVVPRAQVPSRGMRHGPPVYGNAEA